MRVQWRRGAATAWMLGFLSATPAAADQNDARLPALFSQLAAASSAADAKPVEARIWEIWLQTARPGPVEEAMRHGLAMMTLGQPHDALRDFDQVVDLAPDYAEGWNRRATLRYHLGDLEGSAEDIARTLSLEPRHFGALSGLGLVRLAQGRPADALAAFEEALRLHPFVIGRPELEALRERVRGKPL